VLLVLFGLTAACAPGLVRRAPADSALVGAVESIGMTVADLDRSVDFYSRVLGFEVISDVEATGTTLERLEGVFGVRMRVARMRLGDETVELTEYLAPRGRPIPAGRAATIARSSTSRSSRATWPRPTAVSVLRAQHVEHVSTGPQRLPDWNPKVPADLAANDVAHWETNVTTADAAGERPRAARASFVSKGTVTFTGGALGFSAGTMVRDPDGHALRVLAH
jgi:catechol 2,3-dioxygenase-like lactoylglutathione lyase family enzyme